MDPALGFIAYAAAASLLVGFGVGWWAASQRKDNSADVIESLKREVEAAKAAHRSYEQSVTEHFAGTAQLLHRMQDDYRSIYSHIASGAQTLCDGDLGDQLALNEQQRSHQSFLEPGEPAPPRDYAPKKSPDERGQLAEDFGLEKSYADS